MVFDKFFKKKKSDSDIAEIEKSFFHDANWDIVRNDGKLLVLENRNSGEKRTFNGIKYTFDLIQKNGWYIFVKTPQKNERPTIKYLYNINSNVFLNHAFNFASEVYDSFDNTIENMYLLSNNNQTVLVDIEKLNCSPVFALINNKIFEPWIRIKETRSLYSPYYFYNLQNAKMIPSVVDNEYLSKFKNTYDGYYDSHFERNLEELYQNTDVFTKQKLNKAILSKNVCNHRLNKTSFGYVSNVSEINETFVTYEESPEKEL